MASPCERRLRILLVKPDISAGSIGFTSLARVPPLELLMVAASVPGHECRVLDLRLEPDAAFERALADFAPDVVGVTAYSAEAEAAKALCRRARAARPGTTVVVGGHHATMAPEDLLAEAAVDVLVLGEGEATFPELVSALAAGGDLGRVAGLAFRRDGEAVFTGPRPLIADLDRLPMPDWSLVARYQPHYFLSVMGAVGTVETSRGCPYDCSFCSVWVFYNRRYRKKSPSRVMAELDRLPDGIDVVGFVDDEFWVDADRALELAGLIAARPAGWRGRRWKFWAQVRADDIVRRPELVSRWAAAGLKVLLLGIESCKESELRDLYHKRSSLAAAVEALGIMERSGVEAWGCFIVNPEWEEPDFAELSSFVRRHNIAFPQFTVLTPLPGTRLIKNLVSSGRLDLSRYQYQLLDFLHAVTETRLPLRRFYELLAELYEKTSMAANLNVYRRAVRNGVISRDWLRSEMGRRVTGLLNQLKDAEAYLKLHRLAGWPRSEGEPVGA